MSTCSIDDDDVNTKKRKKNTCESFVPNKKAKTAVACLSCHEAHQKCIPLPDVGKCERCQRKNLTCVPRSSVTRHRKWIEKEVQTAANPHSIEPHSQSLRPINQYESNTQYRTYFTSNSENSCFRPLQNPPMFMCDEQFISDFISPNVPIAVFSKELLFSLFLEGRSTYAQGHFFANLAYSNLIQENLSVLVHPEYRHDEIGFGQYISVARNNVSTIRNVHFSLYSGTRLLEYFSFLKTKSNTYVPVQCTLSIGTEFVCCKCEPVNLKSNPPNSNFRLNGILFPGETFSTLAEFIMYLNSSSVQEMQHLVDHVSPAIDGSLSGSDTETNDSFAK